MDSIFQATAAWAEKKNLKLWRNTEVDSTNDVAKDSPGYDLYLTAHQTAGRGRDSHTWSDTAGGAQLLATWAFSLSSPPQHLTGPLFGLAVYHACRKQWPDLPWSLKAPNDLYLTDKKVGGLLAETISSGKEYRLLIGFGFDVLSAPQDVPEAGALVSRLSGSLTAQEWHAFLDRLQAEFEKAAADARQDKLTDSARKSILEALNRFTGLQEKYAQIDQDGNLYTATRKISWHDL